MNILNSINNNDAEQEQGLSAYTQDLAQETKLVLEKIIPTNNLNKTELEQASEDQNRDFLRACTVFVLSQMSIEERETLRNEEFDFRKIVHLAIEKAEMPDDVRTALEVNIQNITDQDTQSQTRTNTRLNLIDDKSLVSQFYKYLYESFHQNPDVDKAYVSLIL